MGKTVNGCRAFRPEVKGFYLAVNGKAAIQFVAQYTITVAMVHKL
jgi:hypothetical protein